MGLTVKDDMSDDDVLERGLNSMKEHSRSQLKRININISFFLRLTVNYSTQVQCGLIIAFKPQIQLTFNTISFGC